MTAQSETLTERQLYKVLTFPKHLQTTILLMLKNGGTLTAPQVAEQTHRARAVESHYLNLLAIMQVAKKERRGRKVYFSVNLENLDW